MNQYVVHSICRAVWLSLLSLLLAYGPVSVVFAADLTVDEILERSKDAMRPPIRYRVVRNGVSTVVYQKLFSDGALATRMESSSPVRRIVLVLKDKSYEFYPDHGLSIETSLLQSSVSSEVSALSGDLTRKASKNSQVRRIVTNDSQRYFEITTSVPPALASAVAKALARALPEKANETARVAVPRETRTLIDERTFRLVEMRTVSQGGATISRSEYREIDHPSDLRDDLFLPPDGLELLRPDNTQEYLTIVRHLLSTRPVISSQKASRHP
jgi:hypothetical protein